jgi:hypothetical protein
MSYSDINVAVLAYPLQSVSLKSDYPFSKPMVVSQISWILLEMRIA